MNISNRLRQGIDRKFTWLQIFVLLLALIAPAILPTSAMALGNQLTSRSLKLTTSQPGFQANAATGDWTFTFTFTTETVGSINLQMCTDPLPTVTCTVPTGGDISTATVLSSSNLGVSAAGTGSTTSFRTFNKATPASVTGATETLVVRNAKLPTTANTTFFIRLQIWSANNAGGSQGDYGTVASSTATQINVVGDVKETLTFCVYYQGQTCANPDNTGAITGVDLGTPLGGALTTSAFGYGTSQMEATTNANGGYVIQYVAPALTGPSAATIGTTETGISASGTTGAEHFAINATGPNTTVTNSAAPSGGSGAAVANYNSANSYSFAVNTPTTIASSASLSAKTTFTVSYIANIAGTTKPGHYSSTFTYICTPTY